MSSHANLDLTINSICTGGLILFAKFIEWNNEMQGVHLPPIVIECLQATSYLGAITVSCYTVYSHIRKFRNDRKKK